ncbi:MAG: hypothetical protein U0894_05605 [Pirellulales bacterium]
MSTTPMPDPTTNTFVPPFSGDLGEGAQVPVGGRPDPSLVQEVKNEIRNLVAEVAQLAESSVSQSEFLDDCLAGLSPPWQRLAASSGWFAMAEISKLRPKSVLRSPWTRWPARSCQKHGVLLRRVLTSKQAVVVPPDAQRRSGRGQHDRPPHRLGPFWSTKETWLAYWKSFQPPWRWPHHASRLFPLLADGVTSPISSSRTSGIASWQTARNFGNSSNISCVRSITLSLDLTENLPGHRKRIPSPLQCDRVSLAVREGWGYRVTAVSGLDSIDRRAGEVQQLSRLASVVMKTGQPFWYCYKAGQA